MLALALLLVTASPSDPAQHERERIQTHLTLVEELLRARPTPDLEPALVAARARNLDALAAYAARGEFPRNIEHPGQRVPSFIDERGVPCAVGALIIASGHRPLAERIAREDNHVYLDAADDPALGAWIARSGLSRAELALIQPSYGGWDTSDVQKLLKTDDRVALEKRFEGGKPVQSDFLLAIAVGTPDQIAWYIDKGASLTESARWSLRYMGFPKPEHPLEVAAGRSDWRTSWDPDKLRVLTKAGLSIDTMLTRGTLLYEAVERADVARVRALLALGANPDAPGFVVPSHDSAGRPQAVPSPETPRQLAARLTGPAPIHEVRTLFRSIEAPKPSPPASSKGKARPKAEPRS